MFSQTQQKIGMLFIDLGHFGRHVSIHLESSSGPLQKLTRGVEVKPGLLILQL